MGTNYYWRHNICTCCNRYDEWHICKSLVSFQAHFGVAEWDETIRRYTAAPVLVASWVKWKELLRSQGQVWDEYGTQHDTEQFIADVEATDLSARRRQYDWCRDSPERVPSRDIDRVGGGGRWLDADGFSFYGGEFS